MKTNGAWELLGKVSGVVKNRKENTQQRETSSLDRKKNIYKHIW